MKTTDLAKLVSPETARAVVDDLLGGSFANIRRAQEASRFAHELLPHSAFFLQDAGGVYKLTEAKDPGLDSDPEQDQEQDAKSTLRLSGASETKSSVAKKK